MSMLAFSNLFRLTEGTEFATMYRPEDAIFAQSSYCYKNNPISILPPQQQRQRPDDDGEEEAVAVAE
jgi:hypothetical protein